MKIIKLKNITVAVLGSEVKIKQTHEILDIMATLRYTENCDNVGMVIHQDSLGDKFFDLKTKFAGDVLQKFSNYKMSLAIIGDFTEYNSNALRDFIRECNRGNRIFFLDNIDAALAKYKSMY